MEIKRLITAIVLTVFVFIGWNYLAVHMGWVPPPGEVATVESPEIARPEVAQSGTPTPGTDPSSPATNEIQGGASTGFTVEDGAMVTVTTPLYIAKFAVQGGILQDFILREYRQETAEDSELVSLVSPQAAGTAPMALLVDGTPSWKGSNWRVDEQALTLGQDQKGSLTFIGEMPVYNGSGGQVGTYEVHRTFTFTGGSYTFEESAEVRSSLARFVNIAFTVAATPTAIGGPSIFQRAKNLFFGTPLTPQENPYNQTRVAWLNGSSYSDTRDAKDLAKGLVVEGNSTWIGVMNNYFVGMVSSEDGGIAKAGMQNGIFNGLLGKTSLPVGEGDPVMAKATYLFGPKEARVMADAPNDMGKALDYGFFSIIAKPMVYMLDFFYKFVGNYGYAIILMTIVIKILLWPLSHKSFKSMEGLRKIQPQMAEIRAKYADDKEALNRELMATYKRHKVNPAGGCLPMLLQLPIFLGLYNALLNAIELRHAAFVNTLPFTDLPWIVDLSAPDPFLITPIVMGLSMFIQQRLSPAPGDPTQAKIMMFMPLIFTLFFLGFPAGLVLYWLVSNIISIIQQRLLARSRES